MTEIIASNITSPLGFTSAQNYLAIKAGQLGVREMSGWRKVPGQICAASFSPEQAEALRIDGFSKFEALVINSVREAVSHTEVDLSSDRTVFILSTTKANVDELAADAHDDGAYLAPGETAGKISSCLGFVTKPIVVCNACISGVTAQILADRLISGGRYDTAVVCGADCLTEFTVAGFTSFKALSANPCRPFDIERTGLNLGEGAATVIIAKSNDAERQNGKWRILRGTLTNDAYHVSAPSPSGDGVLQAVRDTLDGVPQDDIATITAHGTATMFNDQMESKAIDRAGIGRIPITAYKGCFGHTLGAAGILESIITMCSLDDGVLLPVCGYEEIGVSGKISICDKIQASDKKSFLKIISGFGGCNGAILYSKSPESYQDVCRAAHGETVREVKITYDKFSLDGQPVTMESTGRAMLTEIFRKYFGEFPKFHKMDLFSRLAFLATGLLLKDGAEVFEPEKLSVILFNKTSSVIADRMHLQTFSKPGEFYPSPSTFLYTLPNVVMGEIASKYGIKGETTFIILPERDDAVIEGLMSSIMSGSKSSKAIYGWVNCSDEVDMEADLKLISYI